MSKIPSDFTEQELIDMAQNEVDRRGGLESVAPNIVCLDGHRFRVNYDVPQHITERLEALFWGDKEVRYEEIPEELKAYEEKDGDKDKKLEEDKANPAGKHDDVNK
ncbi:hypothetical protein FPCIR_10490 [Fusarium pseudocircinatum]|uniref:Uncharacterized protein n=1 Tax=Fusarium pseudocircinatum TaxID=56676 RepID=A0A8H5KVR1_9HYPO|nr:hypothetical protein FPCIR_10490 [Fusarium pseudocircinatum]